jgi:hypothetical protein
MFDNFLIYGNAFFGERICEFLGVEEEQRGSAAPRFMRLCASERLGLFN